MFRRLLAGFRRERGSITTVQGVLIFLPVLAFAMGGMRVVQINGDVASASRAAARAASAAYDMATAEAEASAVAEDILAERGVNCKNFAAVIVEADVVGGNLAPGSDVSVEVSCTVDLTTSVVAGFDPDRTVEVTSTAHVDVLRGGGRAAP